MNADLLYSLSICKVGHNSRTCPEKSTGAAAEEEGIDEDEAREQETNWEETMEAAHAAHVADEEDLTQNHSKSQLDENTELDVSITTTTTPPNAATTPATSSEPAPPVAARPLAPTSPIPPTRGRGRTTRRGTTASSTTPPTPTQNVAVAPPPPAQPRVVRHAAGSKSQIPPSPTNAAGPSSGPGSMPQGPLVRPTLQAQPSATSRPPSVTRKTMAAASPTTQSRFTGFMPTPSLKKKKQSGPQLSKPSASNKK
ncbi:proline-rich receptor-like protein kinase PERK2 [Arachis duranensis]|uniref:Proline-rich receptor-like protein kinase PERK2 n=1 Tax=Arachis duranensis TaxID=130453 RepID=A0A6P4BNT3_ARADU|nr:proline-rich receptor-like protein kinase PERK2 [Arachis duranensis]